MDFWICILLSAVVVALVYLGARRLTVKAAKRELALFGAVVRANAIEVYADAESLEYYVRCALVAADADKMAVIVYVPKGHAEKEDMLDVIARLHHRHKNLSYRLI